MSAFKAPPEYASQRARAFIREAEPLTELDPDTEQLLRMASKLSPRDLAALSHIIRRAAEICETDGPEIALAVLDQIDGILSNRTPDA